VAKSMQQGPTLRAGCTGVRQMCLLGSACVYMHGRKCFCKYVCVCVRTRVCMSAGCVCAHVRVCMCERVNLSSHVGACMCVLACQFCALFVFVRLWRAVVVHLCAWRCCEGNGAAEHGCKLFCSCVRALNCACVDVVLACTSAIALHVPCGHVRAVSARVHPHVRTVCTVWLLLNPQRRSTQHAPSERPHLPKAWHATENAGVLYMPGVYNISSGRKENAAPVSPVLCRAYECACQA
jgi:hypothetical protein